LSRFWFSPPPVRLPLSFLFGMPRRGFDKRQWRAVDGVDDCLIKRDTAPKIRKTNTATTLGERQPIRWRKVAGTKTLLPLAEGPARAAAQGTGDAQGTSWGEWQAGLSFQQILGTKPSLVIWDNPPMKGTKATALAPDDATVFTVLRLDLCSGPAVEEGGSASFLVATISRPDMSRHSGPLAYTNVWGDARKKKDGLWHRTAGCRYARVVPWRNQDRPPGKELSSKHPAFGFPRLPRGSEVSLNGAAMHDTSTTSATSYRTSSGTSSSGSSWHPEGPWTRKRTYHDSSEDSSTEPQEEQPPYKKPHRVLLQEHAACKPAERTAAMQVAAFQANSLMNLSKLARLGYPRQLGYSMGSLTTGALRGRVLGTFPAQCTVLATVSLRPRRRAVLSRDSNLKRVSE
jgi:hypothetical protein